MGTGELVKPGATLIGKSPGDVDVLFSEAEVLAKNVNGFKSSQRTESK